ncbi:MAG: hypothetical protein KAH67_09545 [Flavobacteriaceae bacterium]|nr:hypothetical protein [Flavobacteriaceae bacterium]
MIKEKLSEIELDVKYNIFKEQKLLKSIESIKELLNQVDFSVETVPVEDTDKLSKLLIFLKGKALNSDENKLVEILVKNKT